MAVVSLPWPSRAARIGAACAITVLVTAPAHGENIPAGNVNAVIAAINAANMGGDPVLNLAAGSTYTLTARDNAEFGYNGLPAVTSMTEY